MTKHQEPRHPGFDGGQLPPNNEFARGTLEHRVREIVGSILSGLSFGSGGAVPTGTGFRHVTAGVEDGATKLVEDADVAAANKDGAAGTPSMRTLGTGAAQAAAGDHLHTGVYDPVGTAAAAVVAHEGATDPHAGYQQESEKAAASGYASLDGTTRVPQAQLGTGGTGDVTRYLREDRTWQVPPGSGALTTGTVEVSLADNDTPGHWTGRFTITDAAISGTSLLVCMQAPGPYTGKGTREDEAEMQPVQVVAVVPGAGSAEVTWQTPPMLSGPGRVMRQVLGDRTQGSSRRLGRVRGNVKFHYAILAG